MFKIKLKENKLNDPLFKMGDYYYPDNKAKVRCVSILKIKADGKNYYSYIFIQGRFSKIISLFLKKKIIDVTSMYDELYLKHDVGHFKNRIYNSNPPLEMTQRIREVVFSTKTSDFTGKYRNIIIISSLSEDFLKSCLDNDIYRKL